MPISVLIYRNIAIKLTCMQPAYNYRILLSDPVITSCGRVYFTQKGRSVATDARFKKQLKLLLEIILVIGKKRLINN